MNNDLISRSALLEFVHNHIGRQIDCNDIARFPAVDAVEVVRCKDCKFSVLLKDSDLRKESPWCYYTGDCRLCTNIELIEDEPLMIEDEFFCAYGSKANVKED